VVDVYGPGPHPVQQHMPLGSFQRLEYKLRSMFCYYGQHYFAFILKPEVCECGYGCGCVREHFCVRVCVSVCSHIHVCTCVCVCVRVCVRVRVRVHVRVD